jgi:predicted glycogen debranching enzyme
MEDRNFHSETKAYAGPEKDWPGAVGVSARSVSFNPSGERELYIRISKGRFVLGCEWIYSIYQPNEASRGLEACTDLFSPGYFEVSLCAGECVELIGQIVTPLEKEKVEFQSSKDILNISSSPHIPTEKLLLDSLKEYVVKRDELKTVIAGYPWFLDWGRDTLICARGLIAAGMLEDVRKILIQFAKFSENGTLPNIIHGNDVGNRDTSDAPLWLFVACDDFCKAEKSFDLLDSEVRPGVSMLQALVNLAQGYIEGTPNGIKVDPKSFLVYSPSHFTWMDTNYPAGTPRKGYPIEIQALWFAALKFLSCACEDSNWSDMAEKTRKSIQKYFWLPDKGYLSDCLHADAGESAGMATADDHLRPNQLFALTLVGGAVRDVDMRKSILRSVSRLLVPGAIRTLDNSKVAYPLPVKSSGGKLLNMPDYPYWGRYEGNEDARRKPAYHNGTAWTWPFPSYCEAYCMLYGENGKRTAKAILSSSKLLMDNGCLGHLPEILDGDFPHRQRGCDAQAWGLTEFYRVWKMLES